VGVIGKNPIFWVEITQKLVGPFLAQDLVQNKPIMGVQGHW